MRIKPVVLKLEKGHVTLEKQFVYCWFLGSALQTFYVGATWMHPVARAELHLHALDESARIVGLNLEKRGISLANSMRVLSFEVPANYDRRKAKASLISALAKQNLLSDIYFGPAPNLSVSALSLELEGWVSNVVQAIKTSDTGQL